MIEKKRLLLHVTPKKSAPRYVILLLQVVQGSEVNKEFVISDVPSFIVIDVFDSHIQRIVLVCVCVFFPSILDIKFVGRTSRGHTGGRSHRIFNPPSFCGACLDFCREKDSAIPFPRRP